MAETTNNPIWKGDNFGSPKITTKYLNYTGLADFWSRAKTYIDEQDASRNGQNIPLYPRGTESNKSITDAIEDLSNTVNNIPQSDWNENDPAVSSYIKGRTHYIEYSYDEISSVGRYNLDEYRAIYPVIVCFNNSVYEVHEGENQLSFGPPLLVNLEGNTLTIDESSYVNEDCKIKIATHIQKLNPIFMPDLPDSSRVTIEYVDGTLNMSNVNEIQYNSGTLNLTL